VSAMPADPSRRTAPYITSPETPREADRKPAPPSPWIAEAAPPEYSIEPAWVDTAGRIRTWALRDPQGAPMAEITTKRGAQQLAALLNRVTAPQREPMP